MRHSWNPNKPRKGYSTCRHCGLQVKNYKIKKGSLPRCDPENAARTGLCGPHPERHLHGMIAGTGRCWNCGEGYTPAEIEWGRIEREKDFIYTKTPPHSPL